VSRFGNRVKNINPGGSKTLYVGGIYEVDKNSGGTVTGTKTYYPAAGAMRVGSTLYYVLKDQLGSASVVTNTSGTIIGEDRFYSFGETRFTTGTMLTDKLFTGQREMADLGIYDYGARFYSPKLGRFLSADSIMPGFDNPQNLNRFSYVRNNPLRYIDPTGHMITDGCQTEGCTLPSPLPPPPPPPAPEPDPEPGPIFEPPTEPVPGPIVEPPTEPDPGPIFEPPTDPILVIEIPGVIPDVLLSSGNSSICHQLSVAYSMELMKLSHQDYLIKGWLEKLRGLTDEKQRTEIKRKVEELFEERQKIMNSLTLLKKDAKNKGCSWAQ